MKFSDITTKSIGSPALALILAFCSGASAMANDLTPAPLVQWDFTSNESTEFDSTANSKQRDCKLVSAGSEVGLAEITQHKGYVSLNASAELLAPDISASSFPQLCESITILVTMRVDTEELKSAFVWGLVNQVGDATRGWDAMSFSYMVSERGDLQAYLFGGNHWHAGKEPLPGREWFTAVLSFKNGLIRHYLNGTLTSESQAKDLTSIDKFRGFAIGKIFKNGAPLPLSVADVQIFDSELSLEQVQALSSESLAAIAEGR